LTSLIAEARKPGSTSSLVKRSTSSRKTLEVFDFDFQQTLDTPTVLGLARLDFPCKSGSGSMKSELVDCAQVG
jgi:hypothetical protein